MIVLLACPVTDLCAFGCPNLCMDDISLIYTSTNYLLSDVILITVCMCVVIYRWYKK